LVEYLNDRTPEKRALAKRAAEEADAVHRDGVDLTGDVEPFLKKIEQGDEPTWCQFLLAAVACHEPGNVYSFFGLYEASPFLGMIVLYHDRYYPTYPFNAYLFYAPDYVLDGFECDLIHWLAGPLLKANGGLDDERPYLIVATTEPYRCQLIDDDGRPIPDDYEEFPFTVKYVCQ
jgi:hypothetical protein